MAFILSEQRAVDTETAFRRYREYLNRRRADFPRGAYDLATSDWYYDAENHRRPHDAWLESVTISEARLGPRRETRTVGMTVRLLGSYHDGYIELRYPRVFRYQLHLLAGVDGHRDWRFDEFRVTDDGNLLHEIEWWGSEEVARWLIEASDVELTWRTP